MLTFVKNIYLKGVTDEDSLPDIAQYSPYYLPWNVLLLIIIIIIISIFIKDNVLSTSASLPYGPLVNTDINYFRTFFSYYSDFFILDMRC